MLLAARRGAAGPRRRPGRGRREERERDRRAAALGASGPRSAEIALSREGASGASGAAEPAEPAAHGGNLGAAARWGPGSAAAPGWAGGRRRLGCSSRGAASAPASAPRRAPRSGSRGAPECVSARRGSRGGLRPVRPGGRGCHRPRAPLAPLPLSSRLSPCSPPPSVSLDPPPPEPPSAWITCRHRTHGESLPCLSPRFRSSKDTWLPSSVRPPRSHRLLPRGVDRRPGQTTGPRPQRLPLARGGGGWGAERTGSSQGKPERAKWGLRSIFALSRLPGTLFRKF